jgi:hypothetical protein
MPGISVFSSFTFAYLPRARVLLRTLKAAHPDWEICALVVETAAAAARPGLAAWVAEGLAEFDRVVFAHELGPPRFAAWMFRHDVVEACTAMKGRMLRHLLDGGAGAVIYLDPDIAVFHPLDSVLAALGHAAIVLTPHQTQPNERWAAIADNELGALRHGVFNLGFLAVRNDPVGNRFALWWDGLLCQACYDEPDSGIFTDQKYCDLVPAFFAPIHILDDPGCNVASWNLSRRRLAIAPDGTIRVNGAATLKFYHFTKINTDGDIMTERYSGGNIAVHEIWEWYRHEIRRLEPAACPDWSYGRFADGAPIPRAARLRFRRAPDLLERFADPFASGDDSFQDWLRREAPAGPAASPLD